MLARAIILVALTGVVGVCGLAAWKVWAVPGATRLLQGGPSRALSTRLPWYDHPTLPPRIRSDGTQENPFDKISIAPVPGKSILPGSRTVANAISSSVPKTAALAVSLGQASVAIRAQEVNV